MLQSSHQHKSKFDNNSMGGKNHVPQMYQATPAASTAYTMRMETQRLRFTFSSSVAVISQHKTRPTHGRRKGRISPPLFRPFCLGASSPQMIAENGKEYLEFVLSRSCRETENVGFFFLCLFILQSVKAYVFHSWCFFCFAKL